jgi:hypothetical protein
MPLKRIRGLKKVKKTKQTLLPGVYPLINDIIPVILVHFDLTLRRVILEPLKSIELKRYT